MYACIVEMNGHRWRSSFFAALADAIEYAERNYGIVAIEKMGQGIVWERGQG